MLARETSSGLPRTLRPTLAPRGRATPAASRRRPRQRSALGGGRAAVGRGAGDRADSPGGTQVPGDLRSRLDRARRGAAGLRKPWSVRGWQFRNEVAMAHAATALRGNTVRSAVVTSIGPGAMQALAGALAAASNGIGVYHIYGDETTYGEGYNMQQVPKPEQGLFGRMTAILGGRIRCTRPRRSAMLYARAATVLHPWPVRSFCSAAQHAAYADRAARRAATRPRWPRLAPPDDIESARRLAIRCRPGGHQGRRRARGQRAIRRWAGRGRGAAVCSSPGSVGVLPTVTRRTCTSPVPKDRSAAISPCGKPNSLIVIGSRAVCQADCSGIGWPKTDASSTSMAIRPTRALQPHLGADGDITAVIERND